jgi:predicted nucleotidyltransferase
MSGNFTQRGEPAMIDKFTRTKMALSNRVDLVIELPMVFSVQSANMFAYTSVSLLHHLQVDEIYFGSESGDIEELESVANLIDSEAYNTLVKRFLKEGYSYPTSSDKAIRHLTTSTIYDSPNNILGIQYIKAAKKLQSKITLKTFQRHEAGYYSTLIEGSHIQSATSIRKMAKKNEDIKNFVPKSVLQLLQGRSIVTIDDFKNHFAYLIKSSTKNDLANIFGMTEGLENRILKAHDFDDMDDLILQIISRRYTNGKIKRILMHMICNTKTDLIKGFDIPYIRVLGMNTKGQAYLSQIKKDLTVPLITKIKNKKHPYLEHELRASKVYSMVSDKDVFQMEFDPLIIV